MNAAPRFPGALRTVALVCLLALAGAPAGAQPAERAEGRISTHAFAEMAPAATIVVDVLDDSDINLRVARVFAETLRTRGHTAAETGRYTLEFQTQEVRNLRGDGGIAELSVSNTQGVRMHMNLWSSTRDSLLRRRPETDTANVLRLDATVRDNARNEVVWQGQAFAEARGVDRFAVFRQMVPQLVDRLGTSVEVETFPID